ncbi:hypothetical protein BS78_09G215000 [Paspalum vaginatum]|nr:hypothetical protein BS78_09G215000 [Paspalum vaginatum]
MHSGRPMTTLTFDPKLKHSICISRPNKFWCKKITQSLFRPVLPSSHPPSPSPRPARGWLTASEAEPGAREPTRLPGARRGALPWTPLAGRFHPPPRARTRTRTVSEAAAPCSTDETARAPPVPTPGSPVPRVQSARRWRRTPGPPVLHSPVCQHQPPSPAGATGHKQQVRHCHPRAQRPPRTQGAVLAS